MEPDRQVEIQLGHMCNNRCVFCVSGQRTALGEAGPMDAGPILEQIAIARKLGHTKITLLGGEPTLQPAFLDIVRHTVALGFEEIVLFTNGAKTARPELIDEIRATGGRFTWRISIQGATEESHERTTKKPGSFGRILRTLSNLQARGEHITVNMCVVQSNFEDVPAFAALLLPYGVRQLHLDMVRPLDAGDRTEDELRAMIPRYEDLATPFRAMVAGFPEGFDVNLGNVPFCIAPDLTPVIHHDGEATQTIAIDGDDRLSRPFDKYLVKRRDKIKPASCAKCLLQDRCSGVFEHYARFYGVDALVPIDAETLARADRRGRALGLYAPALLAPLASEGLEVSTRSDTSVELTWGEARLELRPARDVAEAVGVYESFTVHHHAGVLPAHALTALARTLASISPPIAPIGEDLVTPPRPRLKKALSRLRAAAPFGGLALERVASRGDRIDITFLCGTALARVWLDLASDGAPRGGYKVEGEATDALREGLRDALHAVRGPSAPPSSEARSKARA